MVSREKVLRFFIKIIRRIIKMSEKNNIKNKKGKLK